MPWFWRLRNTLRAKEVNREIAEEIEDHIARRAAELQAEGMQTEAAQLQARRAFGNATQIQEKTREMKLPSGFESVLQDLRYGWRSMRKSPGFTATAILSLSLAIGANMAIYSIVDAALLRPLPVPDPDRLVTLATPDIEEPGKTPAGNEREGFSYPIYRDFKTSAGGSARLFLSGYPNLEEVQDGSAYAARRLITQQWLSGNAFAALGVTPVLGRLFSSEDDRVVGAAPYAVLSYDYWQRHYNGNAAVLGQSIRCLDQNFQIVGVTQKGFFGIEPGRSVDIWLPASMYNKEAFVQPGWAWFRIIGRLAPGVTRWQLQQRLQPSFHVFNEQMISRLQTAPPPSKSSSETCCCGYIPVREAVRNSGKSSPARCGLCWEWQREYC